MSALGLRSRAALAGVLIATVALAGLLAGPAAPPAAARATAAPTALPAAGTVSGAVVSFDWSQLTVRLHGRAMGVRRSLVAAADAVGAGDYPYVWGGGHLAAGTPGIGVKGPGYNGRRLGYDCSGVVAAVLAGAGLWPVGTRVPSDSGIIAELRAEHLIVRGAGTGPRDVTLWDRRGRHIFMEFGERFFGTSDGGAGSPLNPNGGAGWLDDGAPDIYAKSFRPYHLVPAALSQRVIYGPTVTLALTGLDPETLAGLALGSRVRVQYRTGRHRVRVAAAVTPVG